ncbi:MAG: DMT family transporter [Rhodospirillaceae bacterium]|jgi:drug/metabolite transporter (DMT)-like permease|nr:DMT family transporter [Rhodospirillales bacterium]MBT3906556.1 DMT family transporter [Rhodospirillaceae bacterium]MBT4703809.1 DMT family transporter [Rhodospirillaceae bacterium]MBT5035902.1 DMT family transporter [Rhodospirillaceae bacterium]MBT6222187.1 DMT family transporter [Rhodospirillaceae bacterium]
MPQIMNLFGGEKTALKGMIFMLLAAFFSGTMNSMVRYVSDDIHTFEIVFFRLFFGFLFFLPVFMRHGFKPLQTERFGLHLFRSSVTVFSMSLYFAALALAPLAKVIALTFTGPLISTLLAVVILGEIIRIRRIVAVIIGFIGAVVIVQPGVVELDAGSMFALASATTWAVLLVTVKILSRTESSVTLTIYGAMLSTPIAFVAACFVWTWPTWEQLAWLAAMGSLGSIGLLCMSQSFRNADMTVVIPIAFTRLLWVALFAYLFFAEVPGIWTFVGAAMIFSATTYIAFRERKTKDAADKPPETAPEAL